MRKKEEKNREKILQNSNITVNSHLQRIFLVIMRINYESQSEALTGNCYSLFAFQTFKIKGVHEWAEQNSSTKIGSNYSKKVSR